MLAFMKRAFLLFVRPVSFGAVCFCLCFMGLVPLQAQEKPKPAFAPVLVVPSLDPLFERLKSARTLEEAKGIVTQIERRWMRSGSDTADLLMARAAEAFKAGDFPLSLELLDRIIALEPQWAEGWYRRALVFSTLQEPVRAIYDLRQTLALEPRHFSALAGLGQLFQQQGDTKRAVDTFRRVLTLHPYSDVQEVLERLVREVEGRDI